VGQQLLFWGQEYWTEEVDDGHVESHLTSKTVQLKGPERSSQQDTLPWWRWERPIGFMTAVNNRQAEHQSTVLEASGAIANEILVFVRPGATESSNSSTALKGFR
jgi:hypothetical protein